MLGKASRRGAEPADDATDPEKPDKKFDLAAKKTSLAVKTTKNFREEAKKSRPPMSTNRVIIITLLPALEN